MRKRNYLTEDRSYSELRVYPSDWNSTNQIKGTWRVMYRYFDDRYNSKYPKGFQVCIKEGFSKLNLSDRRKYAKEIIKREVQALHNGYNPIDGIFEGLSSEINRYTPVVSALRFAHGKLSVSDKVKKNLEFFINRFEKSFDRSYLFIGDMKIKDIREIFERMNMPDGTYNLYLSYMSILINILIEYDIFEFNFVKSIRKKRTVKKIRDVITKEVFSKLQLYLKDNNHDFYRYMMIFFYSASRTSELLRIKKEEVNITDQYYTVTIYKGGLYKQVRKPITNQAIKFWIEIMDSCEPGQYLFGKNLMPSFNPIQPYQITKRFSKLKKKFNISADFYSLKHLFLMEAKKRLTVDQLRVFTGHTNNDILSKYLVNQKDLELDLMKSIEI